VLSQAASFTNSASLDSMAALQPTLSTALTRKFWVTFQQNTIEPGNRIRIRTSDQRQ
jgi:hypothetical protein